MAVIFFWGITFGGFLWARLERGDRVRATVWLVATLMAGKALDLVFEGSSFSGNVVSMFVSGLSLYFCRGRSL